MTSQSDFDYRFILSVCEIIFHIAVSHCRIPSLTAYYDRNSNSSFFALTAYIYIRGEFYNEASNLQVAINEVSHRCIIIIFIKNYIYWQKVIAWNGE